MDMWFQQVWGWNGLGLVVLRTTQTSFSFVSKNSIKNRALKMTVTSFGPSREAADLDQVRPQLWRQWAPCLRRTEEQITMNDVIKVMLEAVAT